MRDTPHNDILFYESNLSQALQNSLDRIAARVDSISRDQFLSTPDDLLVENMEPEFLISPLVIYEDLMKMEHSEVKVDVSQDFRRSRFSDGGKALVSGIGVSIYLPYSGDSKLWMMKPDHSELSFPRAKVGSIERDGIGHLRIEVEQPTDEPPENIKGRLDETLKSINFFITAQRQQIEPHNQKVPRLLYQTIQGRRKRLRDHEKIEDVLKIPLRRREGTPPVEQLPLQRRLIRPLPKPPESRFKPEPGIAPEDYEHILAVIRHEGRTFEITPKTYCVHDEEELRDILLAHLNGHYMGDATGETFRRTGKTDIRIETDNRAAFVAECKIWRGKKQLVAALNQLLGYLTWRDCRAALVIFDKDVAGFSEILSKVPEILKAHPGYRRDLYTQEAGEWRFEFASKADEVRRILTHVFLFNLYVKK